MVSAIFRNTILQVATPDSLRGRLQGVFIVVVAGGPRFGDVESGTVGSSVGTELAVVSGGIACLLGLGALAAHYRVVRPVRREGPGAVTSAADFVPAGAGLDAPA